MFRGRLVPATKRRGTPGPVRVRCRYAADRRRAARAGAACAFQAAKAVSGSTTRAAFALSHPPRHHAGADSFGGCGFLNNAALAAQTRRDHGEQRVAVLDVDYHHGHGTQAVFYARDDVLTVSIQAIR